LSPRAGAISEEICPFGKLSLIDDYNSGFSAS
jgi:hypothetical protein